MESMIDAFLSRSRTVVTILVVLVFAGLGTYISIPKEADPDIPIPFVLVQIPHPGISPEDAERLLIRPMETKLRTIEGLEEIKSYGNQGMASIALEFDVSFNVEQALLDVREQVDLAKADLPQETEEPIVQEFNASLFPVIVVAISGDVPQRTLYRLARDAKDAIESIPSVLEANITGQNEELLEVVVDPAKLESYNISQQELITAVSQNNQLVAAGSIDTGKGRFQVKVPGLFETREDVLNLPIRASGDGTVTLSDVAEIRRTFKDATKFARFNGSQTIAIEVVRRTGTNVVENNLAVRDVIGRMSERWPDEIKVDYTLDMSSWIYGTIDSLESSITTAIVLVMIIVVSALGLRSAGLVGIAIPSSFMIGFFLIGVMGMTLNMMVMFGMVLSVGILVDGAIVVVEYADRKMSEGLHRVEAYSLAAKRMFWPIVSSTGTTLAAFVPLLFWPGVSGKFMVHLPITLIFVLSASLLMALVFLPVLGSIFGRSMTQNKDTMKALAATETGNIQEVPGFTGYYARTVAALIHKPLMVITVALCVTASIITMFMFLGAGVDYFIDEEPDSGIVLIGARGNLSAEEMRDLVVDVEEIVSRVDGVATVYAQSGTQQGGGGGFGSSDRPADAIGDIFFELEDWRTRSKDGWSIIEDIRKSTNNLPGLRVEARKREQGPPRGKDIQLEVKSNDNDALLLETHRIAEHLREMPGLIDIEDSRPLPGIEMQLTVDREQAGRFGADIVQVGAAVQLVTNGVKIGEYRPDDAEDEVEIRARFPQEDRGINQLDTLRISTPQGNIPITNFVERKPMPRVSRIERVDGYRVYNINANAALGYNSNDKIAEIQQWLDSANIDPAVIVRFGGAHEESQKAGNFLFYAFLSSLFLMAIILLTQFNSFYHALLILSSVIFSTVGVLLGMLVTGQEFSVIMTGTGILALAGIVVNNNIVLIDTYQRLIASGFDQLDAIVRTAAQRLRPVFLTTITTICGLLPMVFQLNVDFFNRSITVGGAVSYWWLQMSTAIVSGLAYSTILTLLLTPVMLALPYVAKQRLAKYRPTVDRYWSAAKGVLGSEDIPSPTRVDRPRPSIVKEKDDEAPLRAAE